MSELRSHGDAVWVQPIPNVATSTGGTGPLAIVDGVAVVRYGHLVGYHAIDSSAIAFDLTDGHVLWDHVLTPFTPHKTDDGQESWPESLPSYVSDVPAGKALFSFAEDGRKYDSVVETRTIARTGAVTWAHPSASEHFAPIAFGDDLALHYGSTAWLTMGGTGTVRRLKSWGTGCTLGIEYLVVERTDTDRGARLVAYASADAKPRVIAANFDVFDGYPYVRACGRQGDHLVFLVESSKMTGDVDTQVVEAIVTDREGKLLHRIEVGHGPLIMETPMMKDPAHTTFGGELPRFTLFPDSSEKTLVMVDLETGAIVWRSAPNSSLLYGELFHVGTRWIWSDGAPAPTIAVFDGVTGKLTAAVNAYSYEGVLTFGGTTAAIATKDTLWLHTGDWTTPDDTHIAVLDLATLAPRFVRAIKLTDATAAVRAKLGL